MPPLQWVWTETFCLQGYHEDNEKHCQDDYSLGIEMMGKALQAESRICKGTETQKLLACAGNGEQL